MSDVAFAESPEPIMGGASFERIKVPEITEDEKKRYENSMYCLSNATVDYDTERIYLSLRQDEQRKTTDDIYRDNTDTRVTDKAVMDRWIRYYTAKKGVIESRVYAGRNMMVESLIPLSNPQIEQLDNGVTLIVVGRPGQVEQMDIEPIKVAMKTGMNVVKSFGLLSNMPDHMVILTPQASLADSQQDPTEKVVVVGTHNITDLTNSDVPAVTVHESIHAMFQETLLQEGVDYDALYPSHFLCPTLRFFNEGIATLAQETVMGVSPKAVVLEKYQEIPEALRSKIEDGTYAFSLTYQEGQEYISILQDSIQDYHQRNEVDNLLRRHLPASVVDFCTEKGICVQNIVRKQLEKFNPVKKKIAIKYDIRVEDISTDPLITLHAIKQKRPGLIGDYNSSSEIVRDIENIKTEAVLKPFEAIGKITNKKAGEAAQEFLKWLKE